MEIHGEVAMIPNDNTNIPHRRSHTASPEMVPPHLKPCRTCITFSISSPHMLKTKDRFFGKISTDSLSIFLTL